MEDWGWIPGAPNKSNEESFMYLGGLEPNLVNKEISDEVTKND